jgi:phage-related protein
MAIVGTATVQVEADLENVREDIKRQLDEALASLQDSLKVKIKVELDTAGLSARLDELAHDRTVNVKADTGTADVKLEATKLKAEEAAKNRTAKIDVDKDEAEQGLIDFGYVLDKLGLQADAFGNTTTAKFGLIAVGIESAVAAVGEAFVAIPALIGGLVTAIGPVLLGLDGIKAAAQSIAPEFDALKQSVSATFQQGLTPIFQNLATVLFPAVKSGLNDVAESLVGVARNFADALTSASGLANIKTLIDNTKAGLDAFGPVIRTVTDTFLQMAAVGSQVFVPLANMLQQVTTNFQQMIQASINTGVFQQALNGLVGVLGALGDGINKLLGFAIDLGASLGGPLADALNAIFALIEPLTPLAESLGKVLLDIVKTIAQTLLPVLSGMTPAFENLTSSLGDLLIPIIESLGPPLGQLVNGFVQLLTALEPLYGPTSLTATAMQGLGTIMEGIAPLFDAIGTALGKVVEGLNDALSPIIPIVAQMFSDLAGDIGPLIVSLGDAAGTILQSLEPALKNLFTAVGNLVTAVGPLIRAIGEFATQLADAVAPVLPVIFKAIQDVVDAVTSLVDPVTSVAKFLLPLFVDVVKALVAVFQFIGPLIGPVVTGLLAMKGLEVVTGILGGLKGLLLGLAGGLESLGARIPALAGAADAAAGAVGRVGQGVGLLSSVAGPAAGVIGYLAVVITTWNEAQQKAHDLNLLLGKALDQGGASAAAASGYLKTFDDIVGALDNNTLGNAVTHISFLGHTFEDLLPTTANAKKALDDYKKSLDPIQLASFNVSQAQQALTTDIDKYGASSGQAVADSFNLRDAQQELADKQLALKVATEGVNGALKEQLTVTETLTNSQLGANSSLLNAEQSFKSYGEAVANSGADSIEAKQAYNSMEQSIESAAEAAGKAAVDALGPNASAADKATAYTTAEKDAFNKLTTELGYVPTDLQAMADTLNQAAAPALSTTSAAATGTTKALGSTSSAATGTAGALGTASGAASGTSGAMGKTKEAAQGLGTDGFQWLSNVPILGDFLGALGLADDHLNGPTTNALENAKKKTQDTGTNGFSWLAKVPILGDLLGGLGVLDDHLNGPTNSALDGTKTKARDTGDNGFSWLSNIPILGNLIPGLNTLQGNLNGPTNTALRGTATQAGTTGGSLDNLTTSVNGIPQVHNTNINADTSSAKSTIGAFLQKLGGLPLVSSFMNIAGTIASWFGADGGIVKMMAEGGMMPSDVATIVAPNTFRVIGDRPVGDEAFIPITGDARSRTILGETAKRMGYSLLPMADGGLIDQFTVQSDVAQQFLDSYQGAANSKSQAAQAAAASASTAGMQAHGTNVSIVQQHAAAYGWETGTEWVDLVNLINRESGFNNTAQNPTSTAYGMFQFLNSTWAPYGPKTSDPNLQAAYGLQYIRNRYGDPIGAWGHEVSAGWYDEGGWLRPGMNFARNDTGHGEMVFPEDKLAQIIRSAWGSGIDQLWARWEAGLEQQVKRQYGDRVEDQIEARLKAMLHQEHRPPVVIPPPPPITPPQPTTSIPVTVSTPQGDLGQAFQAALSQFAPELSQAISAGAATQIVTAGTALLSSPQRMAALNQSIADALGQPVTDMATRVQDVISSALPTATAEGGTIDPTMGAAGTLKSAQSTVSGSSTVSHTTPVTIHPGAFQVTVNGNADSVTISQLQRCLKDWTDELLHQVRGRR